MIRLIVFGILCVLIIYISWRSLFKVKTHGFYRFFAWEGMAWIFAMNYKSWFINPFTVNQLISWILLIYSAYLVLAGLYLMLKIGKPNAVRDKKNLFGFEKTTELIDTGVFKLTRHPLYASLIFVNWAILLKNPTPILFIIALISTILLYITSRYDEKECINYFGDKYIDYMKRTKMFIPYLF
ncbi:MAG: methyltransferase [Paludibacter sp.]|nr:methyltransferase [Paludibacter sp.]